MGFPVHTLNQGAGSTGYSRKDVVTHVLINQVAYPSGNGDPASVAAGTPGAGYGAIPTAAFATDGSGASATLTAVMGVVVAPTITAGGTGGTPGAVTLTGTDGTGTKYQVAGVISGGGVLTSITGITVAGAYTALPGTLTAGAVSGGSLSGCTLNLSGSFGVVSYTVSAGSSNHQYAQGTTVTLSGGSPTTAAVPGAVTVTPVAGQGSLVAISGLSLPANYSVFLGDIGQAGDAYVSSRTSAGFTINLATGLASQTLAAGHVDVLVAH
jgi:hypothetical protein